MTIRPRRTERDDLAVLRARLDLQEESRCIAGGEVGARRVWIRGRKQLCKEFEPRLPSRFQAMLQAILSPTTTDGHVQTIRQWESRVRVYEEQSGDNVAENIKQALLQKCLCDGELVRHLNLQSGPLPTCEVARKETISYLRAKLDVDDDWHCVLLLRLVWMPASSTKRTAFAI